jgi:hypothetical protein
LGSIHRVKQKGKKFASRRDKPEIRLLPITLLLLHLFHLPPPGKGDYPQISGMDGCINAQSSELLLFGPEKNFLVVMPDYEV